MYVVRKNVGEKPDYSVVLAFYMQFALSKILSTEDLTSEPLMSCYNNKLKLQRQIVTCDVLSRQAYLQD